MNRTGLLFICIVLTMISCGAPGVDHLDDITSGDIQITVDETIKEPFITGAYNFVHINPKANIDVIALPEFEAYQRLKTDSIRLVIGTRELNEEEINYFKKIKITPRTTPLAYDAVAMITSKKMNKRRLDEIRFGQFLNGEIQTIAELFPSEKTENKPILVFAGSGSGTLTTLLSHYNFGQANCEVYALPTPEEVIDYVSENKNAIGVLGIAWYNNLDRQKLTDFENKVIILPINNYKHDPALYYLPEQGNVADGSYPYVRSILAISREARVGLGTGFISFMASERGQRIILKSGLLPYVMPSRELILYGDN